MKEETKKTIAKAAVIVLGACTLFMSGCRVHLSPYHYYGYNYSYRMAPPRHYFPAYHMAPCHWHRGHHR